MSVSASTIPKRGAGTFPPLVICTVLGLACEIYFFRLFGLGFFQKYYLWPGLLLTAFWIYCVIYRHYASWHRYVWRFASIWSGIWTVYGVTCIVIPLLAFVIPLWPALGWLEETDFNPYLALILHAVMWGCATDVYRSFSPKA